MFLPVENLFSIDSSLFGTFAITLPLLVLFFARVLLMELQVAIFLLPMHILQIFHRMKIEVKTLVKWPVSSNLGFIVGPALAGILGATIYQEILPVLAALFLSLLTLIVIGFALKESKPQLVVVTEQIPEKESIRKVFAQECKECYQVPNPKNLDLKMFSDLKHISFLLVLYFFIFLGFNIFYTSFPIHTVNNLKWSVTELGVFYARY